MMNKGLIVPILLAACAPSGEKTASLVLAGVTDRGAQVEVLEQGMPLAACEARAIDFQYEVAAIGGVLLCAPEYQH